MINWVEVGRYDAVLLTPWAKCDAQEPNPAAGSCVDYDAQPLLAR